METQFSVDQPRPLRYALKMQITSSSNEKVKQAKRVRDGREAGLIFIEGIRLAEEALKSGLQIDLCFVEGDPETGIQSRNGNGSKAEGQRKGAFLKQLAEHQVPVLTSSIEVIQALSDTVQSQGIILLARRPDRNAAVLLENPSTLLLGLDRLQDPGNLGTLMRTAEAAGVGGIVSLKGSADAFSPKVLRSSMGSGFRMPLLADASRDDLISLQKKGFKIVAAAGDGEMDYCSYDWKQSTLLLLGNEGRGVAPELMQQCDVRLRIPMHAGVESLNVAAAGAVMLFEAARQRRQ